MKQALAIVLLLCSISAWATDIQCGRTQQPGQRVVCDYAILSHEYDNIYAQQQQLIQQGRLQATVLGDWQRKRDACRDPHCMDGVFAEWDAIAKRAQTVAVAPAMTASQALGPGSATAPASAASAEAAPASSPAALAAQQASDVPVSRQGSAFGVALPQPVQASDAAASAPATSANAASQVLTGSAAGLLLVPIIVLLVVAAVAVAGILVYLRRRSKPSR